MTGAQALQELLDASEDIVGAVIFEPDGGLLAATVSGDEGAKAAEIGGAMLAYADALRGESSVRRLQADTSTGSVFVVRDDDRAVVAATGPGPVAGLVLHDLRTVLGKVRGRKRRQANAAP